MYHSNVNEKMQTIIEAIDELCKEANVKKIEWTPEEADKESYNTLKDKYKITIQDYEN